MIYASSNTNPQEYFWTGNVDNRMRMSEAGGTWSKNSDGSYSLSQNDSVNISILTSNQSGTTNLDHREDSANGFMRNITDWRNIEAHFYVYLPSVAAESNFKISGHGGARLSDQACAGCAYEASLTTSGRSQFMKSQWYPSGYAMRPSKSVTGSITGRWIGMKLVIITQARNNVRMELWLDEGNVTNNWRMVDSTVDTGGWGNQGASCGGSTDQVLDFGGPIVHFKWHDMTAVKVKNLAVREIQDKPADSGGTGGTSTPTTGGTNPSPTSGQSGQKTDNGIPIYSGKPSGQWAYNAQAIVKIEGPDNDMNLLDWNNQSESTRISRMDEIEQLPTDYVLYSDGSINRSPSWGQSTTGTSGGGSSSTGTGGTGSTTGQGAVDQNGVRSTYGTGQLRDAHTNDFRSDSYRWDFSNLDKAFSSLEATVYLAWSNPSDDEYGWTLKGGEHHDGSSPKAYHLGIDNNTGATRLRGEEDHPDYFAIATGGKAVGLSSKYVGCRCICRNMPNGVLCEIWYDDGDNESKPSNNWKRALSHLETEQNWRNPPSDYMALFRMDEGNLSGIKTKWWNLRAILDSDPTTPFSASGGSTGGTGGSTGGTGGSTGGTGGSDPCSCDSKSGGSTGDGTSTNTGSGTGTQTGGSTTAPVVETEPVFLTVNKITRHRWNIILDTDSCNFIDPTDTREVNEFYSSDGEDNIYTTLYGGLGIPIRCGLYCALDESAVIGQIYHRFAFPIKRYGTPTGDVKVKIFDRWGGIKYECPETVEASTLGLNAIDIEFTDFKNTVMIEQYDSIVVEFEGGDEENFIMVQRSETADTSDGIKTMYCQYAVSGGWSRDPLKDVACRLYI